MSMKLEKMDVSSARVSRGWGVSREAIMGVKKCFGCLVSAHLEQVKSRWRNAPSK